MTTKKNSLLFKVKLLNNEEEYNINNFIDLFLEDGLFNPYLNEIYGIATHNYQLKIYNVTFKESTPKNILDDLYDTFAEPEIITTKDELDISIQINRPQGFRQLVTLFPMPFDITNDAIQEITKTWGKLKHQEFGKHKKCPLIHNPYLHLYIEDFKRKNVPDTITFRNRYIIVNIDGEPPKERCNYCKATTHSIEECPKKMEPNLKQPFLKPSQPKANTTYAEATSSTPKTNAPNLLHPSTMIKLKKKTLKKTNENFPPLSPNEPNIEKSPNVSPKITNEEIDINEEVIKSFDDYPKDENLHTKSKNSKENSNLQNNDPSPPASTATSIILKSRKKKTSSQERKNKS